MWKSGMESHSSRDAKMRARVAETSIYAAKVVDAFESPDITVSSFLHEPRIAAGPMHGAVHADLKHCSGGTHSTFAAAHYYADAAKQRRDELLAKYSNNADGAEGTTTTAEG